MLKWRSGNDHCIQIGGEELFEILIDRRLLEFEFRRSLLNAIVKQIAEFGKDADLAIFAVRDYREIAYWFGMNRCRGVVVNGNYSGINR